MVVVSLASGSRWEWVRLQARVESFCSRALKLCGSEPSAAAWLAFLAFSCLDRDVLATAEDVAALAGVSEFLCSRRIVEFVFA